MKKISLIMFLIFLAVLIYFVPKSIKFYKYYQAVQTEILVEQKNISDIEKELQVLEQEIRIMESQIETFRVNNVVNEYNELTAVYNKKVTEYNSKGEIYKAHMEKYQKLNDDLMSIFQKDFGWLSKYVMQQQTIEQK